LRKGTNATAFSIRKRHDTEATEIGKCVDVIYGKIRCEIRT